MTQQDPESDLPGRKNAEDERSDGIGERDGAEAERPNYAAALTQEQLVDLANAVLTPLIEGHRIFAEKATPDNTDHCIAIWMKWLRGIQKAMRSVSFSQLPVAVDVLSSTLNESQVVLASKIDSLSIEDRLRFDGAKKDLDALNQSYRVSVSSVIDQMEGLEGEQALLDLAEKYGARHAEISTAIEKVIGKGAADIFMEDGWPLASEKVALGTNVDFTIDTLWYLLATLRKGEESRFVESVLKKHPKGRKPDRTIVHFLKVRMREVYRALMDCGLRKERALRLIMEVLHGEGFLNWGADAITKGAPSSLDHLGSDDPIFVFACKSDGPHQADDRHLKHLICLWSLAEIRAAKACQEK